MRGGDLQSSVRNHVLNRNMAGCAHSCMAHSREVSAEEFQRTHFPTSYDLDVWKKSTGETVRRALVTSQYGTSVPIYPTDCPSMTRMTTTSRHSAVALADLRLNGGRRIRVTSRSSKSTNNTPRSSSQLKKRKMTSSPSLMFVSARKEEDY